jgi:hypothetical protein
VRPTVSIARSPAGSDPYFQSGYRFFAIKLMQTNGFSFSAHFARIFRVAAGLLNGPMAARGDERNHKPQSSTA